jgi:L-lysine 2,3-aminomutase
MRTLREHASGLAMPQYALDITEGLGKVPVDYVYVKGQGRKNIDVESVSGVNGSYLNDGKKSKCMNCGICKDRVMGS